MRRVLFGAPTSHLPAGHLPAGRRPGSRLLAATGCLLVATGCGGSDDGVSLVGSGATFPAPLYQSWTQEYAQQVPDVRIDYTPKGSSSGINDITRGLVDFAGSDRAMSDEQLEAAREASGREVLMLPMTAGGVVLIYNLAGVDDLKLSREALAGIFLGEIDTWNAAPIAAVNPGVELPDQQIQVVRRAEGSGTTYALTNHLAAISETWREEIGVSMNPDWPVGVGGRKNDGVAQLVQQTPGSIGYVELSFARSTQLPTAQVENRAGNYVAPTIENFQAALASEELPDDLRLFLPDPAGASAWPIVTYSWVLVYDRYAPAELEALQAFLRFALDEGQRYSETLGYVPLPDSVTSRVRSVVDGLRATEG